MPLYEYYCSDCQNKFELLVGHQQADDVVCVKCQGEKVRRLLSVFAAKRGSGEDSSLGGERPSMGGGCCGGACGCH
ncbi:MAG TPA: zinc ribbon domain-containing protein [Ktedonobacteraceae bacterium]